MAEQRLIDANRLQMVLEKNFWHTGGAAVLKQLIDAAPIVNAVDAVEVVRCDECKHGEMQLSPGCTKEYHCHMGVGGTCFTGDHDPDFYCKYGERRDDA